MGSVRRDILGFFFLVSLAQIKYTQGQACDIITSITSTSASSLLVRWNSYQGATNYFLDLRVNSTGVSAPVVVTLPAFATEKEVFGLRAGTLYAVVVKVFQFYKVVCMDVEIARTVPDASQIKSSKAISSSAIMLEWENVLAVDQYFILVNSSITGENYNLSFTGTSAVIQNLRSFTTYDCYVVTSNSAGLGARSRVRTVTTLVVPPAVVTVEPTAPQTVRVRWTPVDRVLLYRVAVTDSLGVQLVSSITPSTFLDVQKILPCSSYQISVSSLNTFLEPGESKSVNYSSNTVTPVTSVSVDYSCASSSATVSWGGVSGADSYRATARDRSGTLLTCSSTTTSCQLTGVGCSRSFTVQVVSVSNGCNSTSNTAAYFQTVPCAPANLQVYRECSSNVIIFSWAATDNTDYYTAVAVDSTGVQQECVTTDKSCFFTDTTCGQSYNLSVNSISGGCRGVTSSPMHIKTAPCKPRNLLTTSQCRPDTLMTKWDASAGALRYTVEGFGYRGNNSHYTCSSVSTSCNISGVLCGESLTMQITAYDDECYSVTELGEVADRVPCVPQNVSAAIDCDSDSITITWTLASGASFYIVTATDAGGAEYTCVTENLKCQIKGLRCGSTYHAFVVSTNSLCNSSASTTITAATAPCPPTQVRGVLDCGGNRALISWLGPQDGALPSFTASMQDQGGGLLSCSTTNSSCWVPSLKCSQIYDITVIYHSDICPSKPSSPVYMESVPCGPQNVHAQVDCDTGAVHMSWNQTDGAIGYVARLAATGSGTQHYCNSTSPSCTVGSLSCGETYVLQVQSYNGTCLSFPSLPLTLREVPCVPTYMVVKPGCGNSTVVTWQASHGALFYRVTAVSNGGYQTECLTNGTSCDLPNLHCSQTYYVSMSAAGDSCSSPKTPNAMLQTAPCAPTNVSGFIECSSNVVTLSWDPSPNTLIYNATAAGADGHAVSCSSRTPGCQLWGLRCGQDYSVRVTAATETCVSSESDVYIQPTAPCAPKTWSISQHCSNYLSVGWTPGAAPLNYSAFARPTNGTTLSCVSDGISCDITGLQCGQAYSVFIRATNRVCTGPSSIYDTVQTAPCTPTSVRASVTCSTNEVRASWAQAAGALSYTAVLSGPGSYAQTCSTSSLSCYFGSLSCAETYRIHVVASDALCNSTVSQDVSVTTAPCNPEIVSANLQCDSGGISVSWHATAGAGTYTALAYAANQTAPASSCQTTNTSCTIEQLACGTVFNVSVLAGDVACNSSAHVNATLKTAPCPPLLHSPPVDCVSDRTTVSWTVASDVTGVVLNATSVLGHSVGCSSMGSPNCTLQGLQCGQTYAVQASAQDTHCSGASSPPLSIVTVPCTPTWVVANYTCASGVAVLGWAQTLGADSFVARVEAADHNDSCSGSSSQTYCTISTLLCGRVYNVSLQAQDRHCNSSSVARSQIHTAPCVPQSVSVNLQCTNNTASVTWLGSSGATGYIVSAVSPTGDTKSCRTPTTSCQIPGMSCAQTYNIVVTPFSNTCNGSQSNAATFTAGPCPPTGVQVNLVCANNVASVSWTAVPSAEMYMARAISADGQTSSCTTNTTSCSFLDLSCGKNYTVTVVTVERGCQSDPSMPVVLRSVICPPNNLVSSTQCRTNDITISWDPSLQVGVTYILFTQQEGGANSTSSTTATSVTLTGLYCGMAFTVQLATQDNTCTSRYSSPVQVHTAPCAPSGLVATADCGTNLGHLSWVGGAGSLLYIATLVTNEGHVTSCSSTDTFCVAKLECNRHYTATVVSSYGACNSSANSTTQFNSAPCLASNIHTQLDCLSNTLAVQWDPISGDSGLYTALAISNDGTRASCDSNSTSCTIRSLWCGRIYSISVKTSSIHCDIQGSDYQVQTVPCQPQSLSTSLQCSTNVATVSWVSGGLDQSYRVSAVNYTGGQVDCVSSDTNCTFRQFLCGESYTLTAWGETPQCRSSPSATLDLNTAPCVPTHVTAKFDCNSLITSVMWEMSRSADSYVVYAVGSRGDTANCTNVDTNCVFPQLPCGQDFTFTVVAQLGTCTSQPSQRVNASTGPCPLSNPHVSLDCSSNSALVSWTPGAGVLFYNATADGYDVGDRVTCGTTGSACNITHLQCATFYQISISGQGQSCSSSDGQFMLLKTAPCPPTNVSMQTSCGSSMVSVSWAASQGSSSYQAVAQSSGGYHVTCNARSVPCDFTGLQCGQTYEVHVSGVDNNCIGPNSDTRTFTTAPCVPQNVQAILHCQATVLNITWQQTGDATHYHVVVQSSEGQLIPCDTDRPFCTVPNILCGQTYSVVAVVAQNRICNSTYSTIQTAVSAPCPPQTVNTSLDCLSDSISVTWSPSVPGVRYTVQAVSPTATYTCTSTYGSCNVTVPCGVTYNVSVTPVQAGCSGAPSPYRIVQSAPCAPVLTRVQMDCLSDSAWVIWENSAGAEFYIAIATNGDGQQYTCNSSDSTCAADGLLCGRRYNFSVTAFSKQCHSGASNTVESETAPCAPLGVTTSVDCANGTLTVRWAPTALARRYTALVESSEGNSYACCAPQNATSCQVSALPCGDLYMVTVIAAGSACNSSESIGPVARTAPCTPLGLNATMSCSNNVATLSWLPSAGGQIYTVYAVDETHSLTDSCESLDVSCDLIALACGRRYTATVVARDGVCTSPPSWPAHIRTVPCVPVNVSGHVGCDRSLSVSWQQSAGATFYTATVLDSSGHSTSCGSTGDSCNVTNLSCGNIYHTTVVASNPQCSSRPSRMVDTESAPCAPSTIQSVLDCETGTAILSWEPGAGALVYTATAVSASGQTVSCGGPNTGCELLYLTCGSSYKISVQAQGQICNSSAPMNGYLDTRPCPPQHIEIFYTPFVTQFLWDVGAGAKNYTAEAVTPQGQITSCSSQDTSCALSLLTCGQTYNVTVTANSDVCPGSAVSSPVPLVTEPCPPTDVRVRLVCSSSVGVVSWGASVSALGYLVILEGRGGDTLSCHSSETSCRVPGLQCGTAYVVTAWAIGSTHNSSNSISAVLTTAPCLPEPSSVTVAVNCDTHTALVRWAWTSGASSYEVTVASSDGDLAKCVSNQTQCNFTNLICGQTYNVSLTAINSVCEVPWNTGLTFQTWPCVPQHVGVNLKCGTSTAVLTWEQGSGVVYYQAQASVRLGGVSRVCNSSTDSCQFSGLQCGAEYSISVRAFGTQCHSDSSSILNIRTEPCQPQHLTVGGACENKTLRLQWDNAAGALGYVAVATGNLGSIISFQTNVSTLEAELPCGQRYNITVVGQDERCSSLPSTPAYYTTAPCVPSGVRTFVQCEDRLGSVAWASSDGAETYIAVARGLLGHTHMCSTNRTTCTWSDLLCGETYTVRVIASDAACSSAPSNSTVIYMAPCVPQVTSSSMDCVLRVGSISWLPSRSAQSYVVTAVASSGHQVALTTNNTLAQFSDLHCGLQYYLTVRAVGQRCRSGPSNESLVQTEPCPPSLVSTWMNCFSSIAVVSWSPSATADHYTATAVGTHGEQEVCMSSDTSCGIATLQCGTTYLVTVSASSYLCSSASSQTTNLTTVPCVPMGVSVMMNCDQNEALLSWNASQGALSYHAVAQSRNNDSSSCDATGNVTSCVLRNLSCGAVYGVQVAAVGDQCSSLLAPASVLSTAPCRVLIGSAYLDCTTNSLLLNWTAPAAALNYTAVARATGGQVSSCSTNVTSCRLTQLACGRGYNVSVVASDGQCSSRQSAALQVTSVPCHPVNVLSSMNCSTQSAHVQWGPESEVESYQVYLSGTRGHVTGCNTTHTSCTVHNLMCGNVYNVSVVAISNRCSVTEYAATQLSSGPCVPSHVTPTLNCTSGVVTLSWEPSPGAATYTAIAYGNGGFPSPCSTNNMTCVFDRLLCGLTYNFAVSAIAADGCRSDSGQHQLSTVPCQPQQVSAHMDCGNSTGLVSWDPGEGPSLDVVVAAAPSGHRVNCTGVTTGCALNGMQCGQRYDISVTAQDSHCNSTPAYLSLMSVPCTPTSIQTTLTCDSNSVGVSWQRAGGALGYQAGGVSADGLHVVSCNSSLLHCDLQQLRCGTYYTVSVVAWDSTCAGSSSAPTQVRTAPCPPQNVHAQVNCSSNAVTVSWTANPDADSFHVDAVASGNTNFSCDTSNTSCSMGPLPCGVSYSVTVRSVRASCLGHPSRAVQVSSVPCIPEGEKGSLDCVTNSVWVSWQPTAGAESYAVLALASDGTNSTCSGTGLYCNVPQLDCGTTYTFRITALNSQCNSAPSNSFQIETGPCALTGVTMQTECGSSSIRVSWKSRASSTLYVATAIGQDNSFLECNTTGTSCVLTGVRCSVQYTMMVSTTSDKCNSLRSPPYTLDTAPCAPENVMVSPVCEVAGVLVSWSPSVLAESYNVTAVGTDGDVRKCGGSAPNCSLSGLHCSRSYTLVVTATAGNCSSPPSQPVTFSTTPCPPRGLAVVINCTSVTATLSWLASAGSHSYVATALGPGGDELHCSVTAGTSCSMAGLQCGATYNFSVLASDRTCNSTTGPPVQKGAVPCSPALVSVWVHDDVNISLVRVSWTQVTCPAVEYLVELTGTLQSDPSFFMNVTSYWTNRTYFEFPVPNNMMYVVAVRAGNHAGCSEPSAVVTGHAGPGAARTRREVPEAHVWSVLNEQKHRHGLPVPEIKVVKVNGMTLHVEWSQLTEASHYILIVKEDTGSSQALVLSENSCNVDNLQPATHYCVMLSARNSITQSSFSLPVCVTTEVFQ
ncbi:uncharacterized protein fndc7b [Brachyhypopomus gauderio]|uniref:uncharacterized protein fndc7b n=1 Tax=Brachyhypopomus gauderio TaxID=698409 RepID=UPI0040434EB7